MTTAAKKLTSARTSLILDQPFWGSLALSLTPKEDTSCDTAWTDGRSLGYNPAFIESLGHAELVGLIAHEVSHCSLGHIFRRDGRDMKQWNVAADIALNSDLIDCGFTLPKGALLPDATQKGKSAEWIFARLPQPKPQPKGGAGKPDPNGKGKPVAGELRDAPTGKDENGTPAPTEGEWKQRTAEALQQAKLQGSLPGGMLRKLEDALNTRVDVRALLLRFFSERVKADYSWSKPASRYLHMGLYLPSLDSVSMGGVAVLCDTSGSTSSQALQFARGILEQVLDEVQPAWVDLYMVDTKVHNVHRMQPGDSLTWEPAGGGGTCFKSFFDGIESGDTQPVCIVGISDLYASFPASCPIPTLWLTDSAGKEAPFGETIFIDR